MNAKIEKRGGAQKMQAANPKNKRMKQAFALRLQTSQVLDNAIEFSDRPIFNRTVFLHILICKIIFGAECKTWDALPQRA